MHFFSSSPPPVSDASDDHYHVPMSVGSQRAMWASMAIFAVSIVTIGGYTAYHQLVMPAPVELGGALSAELVPAAEAIHPVPGTANEPPSPALAPIAMQPAVPAVTAPVAPPPSVAPSVTAPVAPPPTAAQPLAITSAPNSMPVAPVTAPAPPPTAAPTHTPEAVEAEQPKGDVAPATQAASAPTTTLPSYEELIGVGQAFARKGRNRQALEAYQRALDAQPSAAAALAGIAYVHLNAGDPGLAKLFAARAVESDPTSSQGWIVLGAALELLGDRAAARAAYRRCATEAVGAYALECRQLAH
jgi:outer membrane biosynthesis protein TonB